MSKHTPGPWRFFAGFTVGVARNSPETGDSALIATVCATRPEAEGNAHLIAAAPDLLDVAYDAQAILHGLVTGIRSKDPQMALSLAEPLAELGRKIDGAITKAEGRK